MLLFAEVVLILFVLSFFFCLFGLDVERVASMWINVVGLVLVGMFFRFGMYLFEGMVEWKSFEFLWG